MVEGGPTKKLKHDESDAATNGGRGTIRGEVFLMKKNFLGLSDVVSSVVDRVDEAMGRKIALQLITLQDDAPRKTDGYPGIGKKAYLEDWITKITPFRADGTLYNITFEWTQEMGVPGAFTITNFHHTEFYLKTLTLQHVPGHGRVHFICNSWIYPAEHYKKDRVFFANQTYLPSQTPAPLLSYRKEELMNLRGNGMGKLEEWDRVYDYDIYNDLGDPDKDPEHIQRVKAGYRCTGAWISEFEALFDKTPSEFDSFEDVLKLYEGGIKVSNKSMDIFDDAEDDSAWRSDEEFAREMIAGLNPVLIQRLQEFPPKSKLDPELYGEQSCTILEGHIIHGLGGLTVAEAMEKNKVFILDHHDHWMPYLRRINSTAAKTYATRTILFLKEDGTLKPLAIELSLPHPDGDEHGAVSSVYTPAEDGVEGTLWQLAKAYVNVNDSGYHQLICHWLNTHASIEPFIIATHRQLSVLHPIHKLLHPHFKDTMNINALARQTLINAGGFLEITVFPGKYSLEMSSTMYKNWVFPEQALPADLIKRGVAVEDASSPHGVRLLIEDYPYAVDGLEIWGAIKGWVNDYCTIYYETDEMVQNDVELQEWWKEVQQKGHADKKDEPWWPKMQTINEVIDCCTIIIWVASALHAAVNFGQYPYGGYLPNRPSTSRRFIPEVGTPDYKELETNPEKAYLKTITSQMQSILGIGLVEILSRHSSDEVFLGQRDSQEWTVDEEALQAFAKFGNRLTEIEKKIVSMNNEGRWNNRFGPVKMPYTLLYPSSGIGLTGMGIPNSVSI